MAIKSWKHLNKKGEPFQTEADAKVDKGAAPEPVPEPEVFVKSRSVAPSAGEAVCMKTAPEPEKTPEPEEKPKAKPKKKAKAKK